MRKESIGHSTVISQYLSNLPTEDFDCPLMDYGKKLSSKSLVKILVTAQIEQCTSYIHIEEKIRSNKKLQKEIGINSISGSQISRRINDFPTELLQSTFAKVGKKIHLLTSSATKIPNGIGPLHIVDSTGFKLPKNMCSWAFVSKTQTSVKMHTRLVVGSPDTPFPDRVVPSTGNVSDFEGAELLIDKSEATYVMDRGYPSKQNLTKWLNERISFVVRIQKNLTLYTIKKMTPTHSAVLRDEIVNFGISKEPIRYIEFTDTKGRSYRILTTRFDLSDTEILEIYKNRWLIELFFKWIKGHLKMVKIWSTKPQGIWNQMYIALIAYGLSLIVKLETGSNKDRWRFFCAVQNYLYQPMREFMKELRRRTKKSKGRQKVPDQPLQQKEDLFVGTVAMYKEPRIKKSIKVK